MQDSNQGIGLNNLQRLISGNLARHLNGNVVQPQLNFMNLNQNSGFNRRASIEQSFVKIEESEQYASKGRPISESSLLDSKSTIESQNFLNANSRNSLNSHINNLSFAMQKYEIGGTPNSSQPGSLNTLDNQPQGPSMGLNRAIFGQQPLFSNNCTQQMNTFQNSFGQSGYQKKKYYTAYFATTAKAYCIPAPTRSAKEATSIKDGKSSKT